jgi:hypothetical protein
MNRFPVSAPTLLLAFAAVAVLATPAAAGSMVLNPQAGVTWSNYSFDDNESINEENGRVGYAIGGTVRIGSRIKVVPGLYYQSTGFEATGPSSITPGTVTDDVGVKAFHLPVYVSFDLTAGGLRAYAGPSVTMVTSVDSNDFGIEQDDFESAIYGGVLGAGLDFSLLTLDLNYEIGMSDVFKTGGGAKQNVLRALVGIKL